MTTFITRLVIALAFLAGLTAASHAAAANAGQTVTFTASASGTAPFTYQWYKDGAAISGATSQAYVINAVSAVNAGSYTVAVTNSAGSTTSPATALSVVTVTAPAITTQPSAKSVTAGTSTSFSVVATGTAPLTFQWRKDGAAITGATSATYTIASPVVGDTGSYSVVITNSAGSVTSSSAALTVSPLVTAPIITGQPVSASALSGSEVTLSVTASGSGLSYQWKKGGTSLAGATSSSLTLSNVGSGDAGTYTVTVTNSAGSATSNGATLTITALVTAPSISTQPQAATIVEGTSLNLSVGVSGTAPFSYQWRRGGINLIGATSATYEVPAAELTDAGNYSVVVTNSAGSATSSAATVTVTPAPTPPSISTQPTDKAINAGSSVTFSVAASGSGTLTYQWVCNDVDIPGATSATYTLTAAQPADSGRYLVVVRNAYGMDISSEAILSVTGSSGSGNVIVPPVDVPYEPVVDEGDPIEEPTDPVVEEPVVTNPTTPTPPTTPTDNPGTRLSNLSVRSVAGRGGNPLIVGLTMTGASSKEVLVRATGPALAAFGVGGTLPDPNLKVYDNGSEVGTNDNWGANSSALSTVGARVGAFPLVDTSSKDTGLVTTMKGSRTVHVNSARAGDSGVVLVEAYDAGSGASTRMTNASARNWCGTGSDVLVLGFTIDGDSTRKVLVRAVGPGLSKFGVGGVLADPKIELHRLSSGAPTLIDSNDNWGGSTTVSAAFTQAGAFGLDATSKDAALVATLPAGAYTLTVAGVANGTGEALVEIYELE